MMISLILNKRISYSRWVATVCFPVVWQCEYHSSVRLKKIKSVNTNLYIYICLFIYLYIEMFNKRKSGHQNRLRKEIKKREESAKTSKKIINLWKKKGTWVFLIIDLVLNFYIRFVFHSRTYFWIVFIPLYKYCYTYWCPNQYLFSNSSVENTHERSKNKSNSARTVRKLYFTTC